MVVGSAVGLDAKKAAPLAESLVAEMAGSMVVMMDEKKAAFSAVR